MAAVQTREIHEQKDISVLVDVSAPSRREFLYYIWGASIALIVGEATAGLLWFAMPRFGEGEFGGIFKFDPAQIPERGSPPLSEPATRIWMSYLEDDSLIAL